MSRHHKAANWQGTKITKARAILKAQLPLPCVDCGRPVNPGDTFDIGHLIPLALGGDVNQYGASHRSCNRKTGGKLGGTIANQNRKQTRSW